LIKRRRTDDPEDTGAFHRDDLSSNPLDSTNSDWGRAVVEELKGIRTDVEYRHDTNTRNLTGLREELRTHMAEDKTALAELAVDLKANTEVTTDVKKMLRIYLALRGAGDTMKWIAGALAVFAGAVVAIATVFAIGMWALGKGPLPHVKIGEFEGRPFSAFIETVFR
jgi:hypothetical protein